MFSSNEPQGVHNKSSKAKNQSWAAVGDDEVLYYIHISSSQANDILLLIDWLKIQVEYK